ncbi:hypothetical protein J8273_4997 [Carpediemonas membranifera]|uniref:Uncharacterized protein n=1 Tax=Carpediemonas membranifera TaxID=201153 RepID=A0A8J6ASP3_9EUKA|nr:hypothetical protein J8273_4997 [Carpediemonas membranifera]|eukprot:KAG9393511.1 hypothetical protein J8273_4997 [Carpediemonas membranifera]
MKAFESAAVTAFKNSKRAEYAKENEGARIEKEALSVKVRAWRNATSTNALVRDHVTAMVARVRSKEADLAYMKHSCRSYFEEYIIALEWLETPAGEGTPLLPPGTGAIIDYYHKIVRGYKKRVKQLRKSLTAKSEEVITLHRRLLQQQAEREAAYDADKSMDASLPCSPIPPQSGTLSRTSCPRRATNEPEASMSVKRKALIITPEKARPEDSEEESEEEESDEEQEEAKEKRGEAEEEAVNTCDACIQTEPETQTRITSEAAVQTCINAEALTAGCTAIHVKSDGNCVAYCLQAIELGGRVDGDFEKWQRGLCQSVKAKYWSKKNVTERSLTDPDSGYYNSNAIRVWARKQKRNILVVQSYDGYNGMQGISAILYLFDGTTMLAPDADLWGLTDNFAIVIEGDPAHATLYQKKCEVVEIE